MSGQYGHGHSGLTSFSRSFLRESDQSHAEGDLKEEGKSFSPLPPREEDRSPTSITFIPEAAMDYGATASFQIYFSRKIRDKGHSIYYRKFTPEIERKNIFFWLGTSFKNFAPEMTQKKYG